MRTFVTLLTIAAFSLCEANDVKEQYWQVRPFEDGCSSSLHIDLSRNNQDYENPDPIDSLSVDFSIPGPTASHYAVELLKPGDERMLMSVRPSGVYFKETDRVSNLQVATEAKTYEVPYDEKWHEPKVPRFLLSGNAAFDVWENIISEKPVSVEFDHSSGRHYSVSLGGNFLNRIARMFNACSM